MVGRRLFPFGASKGLFFVGEIEGIYHIPLWQVDAGKKYRLRGWRFFHHQCTKNTPGWIKWIEGYQIWGMDTYHEAVRAYFAMHVMFCWVVVSNIFYFHPENWGRFPIWRAYFSDGLVQPPTSLLFFSYSSPSVAKHDDIPPASKSDMWVRDRFAANRAILDSWTTQAWLETI